MEYKKTHSSAPLLSAFSLQYSDECICVFPYKPHPCLKCSDKIASVRHEASSLSFPISAQLSLWQAAVPAERMEGDQGGRLAAHFCINLRIDSIRKRETGEGGRQAAEDDKAPGAGHSTLSKLFRLWLLDEWSALWACIPFAGTTFGFTGAYRAPCLTSPLFPLLEFSQTCREMDRTSETPHGKGALRSVAAFEKNADKQHFYW